MGKYSIIIIIIFFCQENSHFKSVKSTDLGSKQIKQRKTELIGLTKTNNKELPGE